MIPCFFVSDLHGSVERYRKLFAAVAGEPPRAVFLGGDLLPTGLAPWRGPISAEGESPEGFLEGFLVPELRGLRDKVGSLFPEFFVILGNDDPRAEEASVREAPTSPGIEN